MFGERVQSRSARKSATRDRVLESADRLFRTDGFAATTVRGIAADSGVSVGSVMAVGDKSSLLVAIYEHRIADIHRDRMGTTNITDIDGVVGLFLPFIEYFAHDPSLTRHYGAVVMRGSSESIVFGDLAAVLLRELADGLAILGLDREHAERGSRIVYFTYLGLLMASSREGVDTAAAIEQLRDAVWFVTTGGNR